MGSDYMRGPDPRNNKHRWDSPYSNSRTGRSYIKSYNVNKKPKHPTPYNDPFGLWTVIDKKKNKKNNPDQMKVDTPDSTAEKEGGKHSGFYQQYVNKSKQEIQKGIMSIRKQILEHQAKIRDPESAIPGFRTLDLRQKKALLNQKWPDDIARQKEQLDILKGILGEKQ